MPIIITCKKPGFRRCGIAHPAGPVEYPDDRFTSEELARLKKEPKLIVQVSGDNNETLEGYLEGYLDPAQFETMEYPMLKKLAKDMGLEFRSNISKKSLIELISSTVVLATTEPSEDEHVDDISQNDPTKADLQDLSGADQ